MSEILLQTIIEKLEALEIAILKQRNPDNDPAAIKEIVEQIKKMRAVHDDFSMDFNVINNLTTELKRLSDYNKLQQPVSTKIEHRHHLHKGIWISAVLLMTVLFLSWGWLTSYGNKKVFEANDIKYRALKITENRILLNLLYETDSLYHQDESA